MNKNKYFLGRADHTAHSLDPHLCYSWPDGIQLSEKTTAKHLEDLRRRCLEGTHQKKKKKKSLQVLKDRKPHSQTIKKDITRIKMFVSTFKSLAKWTMHSEKHEDGQGDTTGINVTWPMASCGETEWDHYLVKD